MTKGAVTMNYPSWMKQLMNFKIYMLIYFSGGTVIYLLLDLVLFRTGALSTLALWEILLAAILVSVTHVLFYERVEMSLAHPKRIALHFGVNFMFVYALFLLFGWLPAISLASFAAFVGCYTLAYAGLFLGFSIYYSATKSRLNAQLEKFKNS